MSRFPLSSIVLAATFTLAPLAALTAPVAAHAQSNSDYRCTDLPLQVSRAAANSTDANAVQRAQRFITNGRALCNVRADGEAARQYRTALRILGVDEVRPTDPRQVADANATPAGN